MRFRLLAPLAILNLALLAVLALSAKPLYAAEEEAFFNCCKQDVEQNWHCCVACCWYFGKRCNTSEQCQVGWP